MAKEADQKATTSGFFLTNILFNKKSIYVRISGVNDRIRRVDDRVIRLDNKILRVDDRVSR